MKLAEIINNLDKSVQNSDWVYVEDIAVELGIAPENYTYYEENEKIECYWVSKWMCTDTWVGLRAYFFEGRLFAISSQLARKAPTDYFFVIEEVETVKNYILSLQEKDVVYIDELALDKDFGEGFPIQYTGQLIGNKVLYNGKIFEVDKSWKDGEVNQMFSISQKLKLFEIDNPIHVSEVLVPYNLK